MCEGNIFSLGDPLEKTGKKVKEGVQKEGGVVFERNRLYHALI